MEYLSILLSGGVAIITTFLSIILWFMKTTLSDLKEQNKENRHEISFIKETTQKKSDFTEFKAELWSRLDSMKVDFQRALDKK